MQQSDFVEDAARLFVNQLQAEPRVAILSRRGQPQESLHSHTRFGCFTQGETFAAQEHSTKTVQHPLSSRLSTCPLAGVGVQDFSHCAVYSAGPRGACLKHGASYAAIAGIVRMLAMQKRRFSSPTASLY